MQKVQAYYDGKAFVPCGDVTLAVGSRVVVMPCKAKIDIKQFVSKKPFITGDAQDFINDLRKEDTDAIDWAKYIPDFKEKLENMDDK